VVRGHPIRSAVYYKNPSQYSVAYGLNIDSIRETMMWELCFPQSKFQAKHVYSINSIPQVLRWELYFPHYKLEVTCADSTASICEVMKWEVYLKSVFSLIQSHIEWILKS